MFTITQEEYSKIMSTLVENCSCGTPIHECAYYDCDIMKIDKILSQHIQRDYSIE